MQSGEIRQRFLDFFEKRGHAIIPSSPLVPENDPSVLFNTAGMQPLGPYLLGQEHPKGKRIADVQKCVRTNDIEEVGDLTHLTFFEMLGNWSLGDYFKEESIEWSYEFLTSKEDGLGLDPDRLFITCFEGDENAPKDEESPEHWKRVGISESRIYFLGADDNWWSPGDNGPSGPDTEIFYDMTENGLGDMTFDEFKAADDRQDVIEIWNNVFMEYEKKDGKVIGKLSQQNVDTGMGLERITTVVQKVASVFDTDLFASFMKIASGLIDSQRSQRIISDHIRTGIFMASDGVVPSNTDQGYIMRRLLRRAVMHTNDNEISLETTKEFVAAAVDKYGVAYPNISEQRDSIETTLFNEFDRFSTTLERGLREFEKHDGKEMSGHDAFVLFTTHGFPLELTLELANERGITVDEDEFHEEFAKHQDLSRTGSEGKFKGGLADGGEETTQLHTITHLMLAGLRKELGDHVHQRGSNITPERTRFDFTHDEKVSRDVLDRVEAYVNEALQKGCDMTIEQMPKDEAQKRGVEGSFWEKYPDTVNVYTIKCGDTVYSEELCGGPHVKNTGEIKGTFTIKKEEAVAAGVRRVRGVLE